MRHHLLTVWMMLIPMAPAMAQVSVGIGFHNANIGINLHLYPDLQPVPGYPVYYAPRLDSNYFFYDGMYWVYQGDNWYASSWYNGPWSWVEPEDLPYYILRIPVRYYRQPPMFFQGWQASAPPRWGDHWGNAWAQHRSGWDHWDRNSAPAPAPLPVYQRKYSGDRYPGAAQQRTLHNQEYRYQPRETVVRRLVQQQPPAQGAPTPAQREKPGVPPTRNPAPRDAQRANPPPPQNAPTPPRAQSRQKVEENVQHSVPDQYPRQKDAVPAQRQHRPPRNEATQRQPPESISPASISREAGARSKAAPQESRRDQKPGKGKDHENQDDRGQDHGR